MARYARTIVSEARASESERERERPGVALRKGVNHWGCCAGPTDLFDFSTISDGRISAKTNRRRNLTAKELPENPKISQKHL